MFEKESTNKIRKFHNIWKIENMCNKKHATRPMHTYTHHLCDYIKPGLTLVTMLIWTCLNKGTINHRIVLWKSVPYLKHMHTPTIGHLFPLLFWQRSIKYKVHAPLAKKKSFSIDVNFFFWHKKLRLAIKASP